MSKIDEELYDKIVEWCWRVGRKPPDKTDKKAIKRTQESMKILGENPSKSI